MKQLLPILLSSIIPILISCDGPILKTDREENMHPSSALLIKADKDFSTMSSERGMKAALMHYMAKEGVLLRPNENPLVGADAIEYISQVNDSGYTVTLHPARADISDDGTLGYTYGIYEILVQDTTIRGTYINVWKKQNGEWRFMLNSGNQGISSN